MIIQTKLLFDYLPSQQVKTDLNVEYRLPEKQEQTAKSDSPDGAKKNSEIIYDVHKLGSYDINKDYHLQREFKDRISVLTVAYHNLAVE
jgi:hypothetical protein